MPAHSRVVARTKAMNEAIRVGDTGRKYALVRAGTSRPVCLINGARATSHAPMSGN